MSGVYHARGCRCPGCLPGQYVMRPASQRPARNGTVQRGSGDGIGILVPAFLIVLVVALVGFWPAMVWHGEGGPTGTAWRWNMQSTVAELVYWGFLILAGLIIWACRKYADPGLPPGWRPPQALPLCAHRNAVPVDSAVTGQVVAWWCPDCEKQLDPGFRASELRPDSTWPGVRRKQSSGR